MGAPASPTLFPRALCWAVLLGATPVQAGSLTLAQAWQQASRANLELRQEALDTQGAERALLAARGAFDPALSLGMDLDQSTYVSNSSTDGQDMTAVTSNGAGWSGSVSQALPSGGSAALSWTETWSDTDASSRVVSSTVRDQVYLSVSQPLLDGLGPLPALYEVRQGSRNLEEARLWLRDAQEDLALAVIGAYWGLLAARETLVLAHRSAEIAEQQLADTQERVAEGFAASGDLLQVERAVGVARQAVVVAEADEAQVLIGLCRLLGLPLQPLPVLELVDRPQLPAATPAVEEVLATARRQNADLLRQRLALDEAEDSLRLARNQALPELDISASVGVSGLDATASASRQALLGASYPAWALGLDLSVPLPGRDPRNSLAEARLSAEKARLSWEAAVQDLEVDVRAAVRDVGRDQARVALAVQTVAAARAALEADQELLTEGRGSAREVVRSLESLDEAQVVRLQAEIDLQASLWQLEKVQGTVLERLPVE